MTVGVGLPPTVAPACRVCPTVVTPLMVGWLSAGGLVIGRTWADVAVAFGSTPLVAVTMTRTPAPASASVAMYESVVSSAMSGQMEALTGAHRCHRYVTFGAGKPLGVVFTLRVLPTAAAPVFVAPVICSGVSAGAAPTCA